MNQTCAQIEVLLSGYLDRELTQQQQQRVMLHLQECDHCRPLLEDLKEIKSALHDTALQSVDAREIDAIMANSLAKKLSIAGWSLLLLGLSILGAFCVYRFFMDNSPLWFKLTVSITIGGLVFLFGSVLRQRLLARKTDKYRKVTL